MKRPIFIIIGAVMVFILLGVWIYVLFFNSPNSSSDTFSDLNFNDTTDPNAILGEPTDNGPIVDVSGPERLRQLTTKPTVGYQEVMRNASSTPEVFYVEAGTGHIFSINTKSGEESRVSATTIPASSLGAITPNGRFVMVQSGSGFNSEIIVGAFSSTTDKLTTTNITERVVDFKATSDNTFLYAIQTSNSLVAKEYFPISNTNKTVFTIPFREGTIAWGNKATDVHYVYPKTSSKLEGFLYQVTDGKVKRLPIDGYGLSAVGANNNVIFSKQMKGQYQTFFYNQKGEALLGSPVVTIPEKCVFLGEQSTKAICGTTQTYYRESVPDNWYRGEINYADGIWEMDTSLNSAKYLSNTLEESGRNLDIIHPGVNGTDTNFYFINKNDTTLWVYELVSREVNNQ